MKVYQILIVLSRRGQHECSTLIKPYIVKCLMDFLTEMPPLGCLVFEARGG